MAGGVHGRGVHGRGHFVARGFMVGGVHGTHAPPLVNRMIDRQV